ncbi:hypothetical protein [Craterilacuibacter sp. RT1T]|uniref:hypothetical protein n=1 Tax=Craterilacuibacter sp. RT1T TaxID=2942211 RepID=UPI0020BEE9C3|nr:hypothetical protein [Craterilacuibacter sp. RT1T]MCL6263156.1 hypothetical protein [Craterilacuibacter sp. RT1T]
MNQLLNLPLLPSGFMLAATNIVLSKMSVINDFFVGFGLMSLCLFAAYLFRLVVRRFRRPSRSKTFARVRYTPSSSNSPKRDPYNHLLTIFSGDSGKAKRAVSHERSLNPFISRAVAARKAINRLPMHQRLPLKAPSAPLAHRTTPSYKRLLGAVMGDHATADRLIAYEMAQDRRMSPAAATVGALDRLYMDRRSRL